MPAVKWMDREIQVYTCMTDPSAPAIAVIPGVAMVFRAATPMRAKACAEEWRVEAVKKNKTFSKAQKAQILGETA